MVSKGKNDSKNEKLGFSLREIGQAWGLSDGFLRLEIQRGNLKVLRFGRRIVVSKESLERYVKQAEA